ncbi:hypothetical protein C8R45DRAFT_930562 [Mycena sanguinolenta]|nr:hypothetical protein C8R45DRAFT_930562 [Mycena sanguinolenta]
MLPAFPLVVALHFLAPEAFLWHRSLISPKAHRDQRETPSARRPKDVYRPPLLSLPLFLGDRHRTRQHCKQLKDDAAVGNFKGNPDFQPISSRLQISKAGELGKVAHGISLLQHILKHDVHPTVKRSCHLSDCPDHIITLFPRFPILIHLSLHLRRKPAGAGGAEKTPVAKRGTKRSVGSGATPAPAAKRARKA